MAALFEPIKNAVEVADRRPVALVKRACLERQESQLRRASLGEGSEMERVMVETAGMDPLAPPWSDLPAIDELTREAYVRVAKHLSSIDSVVSDIAIVRRIWRSQPRVFALRDDFLSEFYTAKVNFENDASVDEHPESVLGDYAVEDARGLLAADGGLQAQRLKLGERMIRQTAGILFDLVKMHCGSEHEDLVDAVREGFSKTCIRRFRRAIGNNEDGRELLFQLLTINPMRLNVGSMRDVDPKLGKVWDSEVGQGAETTAYRDDLEQLRSAFASKPSLLNGASDAPRTFIELIRAVESAQASGSGDDVAEAYSVREQGRLLIVTLLDAEYSREAIVRKIESQLISLAESKAGPRIVISFAGVQHATSIFIGAVFSLNKVVKRQKGKLALCELNEPMRQVLELSGAHRIIPIYNRLEVAVERLSD